MSPALEWGDRLRRTERFISFLRLVIVAFNSVLYLIISSISDHHSLAVAIIVIAGLYSLVTVFWNPEQLEPTVVPVATMILDNVLIAIWLHATGGFESPFFPLFYAEAAASVGRFGWAIGLGSAVGSAVLYISVVVIDGGAPTYDVIARVAYIFFIAAFVAYVVEAARNVEREASVSEATAEAYAELSRLKAAFVSTVSHELRTPLTTIKGATTTLLRDDSKFDRAQARALLEMVERQSGHLGKLIQDLIDVATLEQGEIEFVFEWCDVHEILAAEADRVTRDHSRPIEIVGDPGLGPVRCDRILMGRVFRNLLDNAVKFSSAPDPIRVQMGQAADRVFIDVIDGGIGVAPEEQERIFDRFYQVDGSLTRRAQGSGIGLNIAREMVRLHRGDIEVQSDLGHGARFRVSLLKDPEVQSEPEVPTARRSA